MNYHNQDEVEANPFPNIDIAAALLNEQAGAERAQRDENGFALSGYSDYGEYTAAYMATLDVITTSVYSCGVYSMVESE